MSEPTADRPRQVTLAGWLIMVGSPIVVALVFQRVSGLHTLESREAVEEFVANPAVSELGVGVDGVITMIRTLAMVTAGCATAAAILGYQVLRRSRAARLALTVLAVPLLLAGLVTGGFLTSVVAAAAVILWMQPARSWFDGTTPPPRREPAAEAPAPPPPPETLTPPPLVPTSDPPARPAAQQPPPYAQAYAQPDPHPLQPLPLSPVAVPTAQSAQAAPARRPAAVAWACALAWAATAVTVIGLAVSAIVLATMPDTMLDEIHRDNPDLAAQGVSDDLLIAATYVMIAGIVVWCIGAAVLALLVFRGVEWARVVLVVSACLSGVTCLVGTAVGAVLLVVPLLASAACVALLLRPDARPWFARRRHTR